MRKLGYLSDLEQSFRHMSDYLYDVSDGQMRWIRFGYMKQDVLGRRRLRIQRRQPMSARTSWGLTGSTGRGLLGAPVEMPRRFFGNKTPP